ncbi:MAG TPA: hypothetical protein VGE74_23955, partial [Gemmata sp.]
PRPGAKRPRGAAPGKAKRGAKAYRPAKSGGNGLILAGVGVAALVLVGAVVAVVMSGGSKPKPKPDETAQEKEVPVAPPQKEPAALKPKDTTPVTVPPKKEPSAPEPPVPAAWAFKERWKQPLPEDWNRTYELRVAPDSRIGQVWCGNGQFFVFNSGTGDSLSKPDNHQGIMYGVYPLDGGRVVRPWHTPAEPIQVWDTLAGKEEAALKRPLDGGLRIWLAPNFRCLAVEVNNTGTGKGQTRLVDASTNKVLLDCDSYFGTVRFTADSSRALIWDGLGKCQWVKLPSGEVDGTWNLADATEPLRMSAMSGDGSRVVFTGRNKYGYRLIDGRNGRTVRSLSSFPSESSLSHDGKLIFAQSANKSDAELAVADTGAVLARVPLPPNTEETAVGIAPDVSAAFVAQPAGAGKFELVRYDLTRGAALASPPAPAPGSVALKERFKTQLDFIARSAHFDPEGKAIVAHDYNTSKFTIIDVRAGTTRTGTASGVLSPFGHVSLPGGRVGTWVPGRKIVEAAALDTGKPVGTVPMPEFPTDTTPYREPIVVSPDNRYVLAGVKSQGRINPGTKIAEFPTAPVRVLDTRTGKNVLELDWNSRFGGWAAFNEDASRVLVLDGALRGRWYTLPEGKLDREWVVGSAPNPPVHFRAMTPDGRVLLCDGLVGSEVRTFVYDGVTGQRRITFAQALGRGGCGLSSDGRRALLNHRKPGGDHDFVIVDTGTGAELARLTVPAGAESASAAILAPDGRALAVFDRRKPAPLVVYDILTGGAVAGPPLAPPAAPIEMRAKWSVETKLKFGSAPAFTGDGQRIAIATVNVVPWGLSSFDAHTGVSGPELPKLIGNWKQPFAQDGSAIGYQSDHGRAMIVWDIKGEKTTKHAHPQPAGATGTTPSVSLSPNGRYMTLGHADPGPQKEHPLTPLQVIDTTTGQIVLKTDWRVGRTLFTADSSRLLVVDADDRFRWYRIPSGKLEAEWTYNHPANGFNANLRSVSADGGVILFHGQPPERERTFYLLDGKTGAVLHGFPAKRYHSGSGYASDNGQFFAFVRNDGFGTGHSLEVVDARGNVFAVIKFPRNSNMAAAVHWKTRTVALHDRTAGTLTAYELPFDPNGAGAAGAQPPAVDPIEGPLVGAPPALKPRWGSAKVGDGKAFDRLLFDPGANAVLLGSTAGGFEALDPRSGAPRVVGFTATGTAGIADFFPLDEGRLGTLAPGAAEVRVWDGTTGRLMLKYPVPNLAPGAGGATALLTALAPNEKHIAVARAGPPALTYPDVPFKVFDTTNKKEELATDWKGGSVHFTNDRVLLAEWSGRCRWFQLPAGAPAEAWTLDPVPGRPHRVTSASANGAVLGYAGPAGTGNGSAVLDGRTGKPLRIFHRDSHPNSP